MQIRVNKNRTEFLFLSVSYVTLTRSVAPSATVLQLNVFLLQMQFVNLHIFSVSRI
jgi:hypothetical protein